MMARVDYRARAQSAVDSASHSPYLGKPARVNFDPVEGAQRLGGSPLEVLEKILPDDPLGLSGMLRLRLRERALFLDFDLICLRLFAHVARMAPTRKPQVVLGDWLRLQVESVLNKALVEARKAPLDWASPCAVPPGSATFAQLAAPLGLDPADVSAACNRFHGLDDSVREAFFVLVLEGQSLDHAARLGTLTAPRLARRARRALDVLRDSKDPCTSLSLQTRQST